MEVARYVNAPGKLGINVVDIVLSPFVFEFVVGTVYHLQMKVFDPHCGCVLITMLNRKKLVTTRGIAM